MVAMLFFRTTSEKDNLPQEVQRQLPVIPLIFRYAVQDFRLGPFLIPRSAVLIVSIYAMHNDPAFWEAPKEFRPVRLNWTKSTSSSHKQAYCMLIFMTKSCLTYKLGPGVPVVVSDEI